MPLKFGPSGRKLAGDALALYASQLASYIFPILLTPYIARTLHPSTLGRLSVAQAFASWSIMVMDFGFSLSASREIARNRDNRPHISQLFINILAAKAFLSVLIVALAIICTQTVPAFHESPLLLWAAVLIAVAQGANVTWFFFGLERVRVITLFDLAAKALSLIGVLLTVHGPKDAWKVLAFQGLGAALPTVAGLYIAFTGHVAFCRPNRIGIWQALVLAWPIFLVNSIITFYGTANITILQAMQTPLIVGYLAGADKITRPFCNLFAPITQVLYPRMSAMVKDRPDQAGRESFNSLRFMVLVGFAIGLLQCIFASVSTHILLGKDYLQAIPLVRLMALLTPLTAAGFAIGQQCMLPLGFEKAFVRITALATGTDIVLALLLARPLGAYGVALAMLTAEAIIVGGNYFYLMRRGVAPHQWRSRPSTPRLSPTV